MDAECGLSPTDPTPQSYGSTMNPSSNLIESMSKEPLFDEFRQAFSRVTGMPLAFTRSISTDSPSRSVSRERILCPHGGFGRDLWQLLADPAATA